MSFYYAITGLVNAIGSVLLGLFIYLKNRKDKINQTFGLLCLSIALWSFPYYIWQISNTERAAFFWSRALMVGAIFIPVTYLHFVFTFLETYRSKRKFLILSYILAFIFFGLNFTPLFVKNVVPELYFPFWPKPGIFLHPFLVMFFSYIIYGCYLLFKSYEKTAGIRRAQISYFLVASLIGFPSGATNYFLWYGISTPPYWNALVILFPILTTYAITKHHLFEIRVILTEALVLATSVALLIQAIIAETILLKVLGGILFVFFVVFGYQLVRSVIKEIELRTQLKQAYDELERIDKAKTEFLSIASHQLRTPLTAVKGYISLILEKSYGEVPEKMKKPLENVFASNERLVKLVNELLNITRLEMGRIELNLEKTHLEEMISSIVEELKITAENKGLYLKWEKPEIPLPEISIDKDKIRQVVLNLVDNAIKYTQEGGITIQLKIEDSKSKIVISDTGVGMEKEEIDKLFDIMVRGKAGTQYWTEGAGLGLYIARKFVEMHGGKVWAESEGREKGSAFFIELPIK
jgi:signal transduction histidine kinase